jgi:hypothetical protein
VLEDDAIERYVDAAVRGFEASRLAALGELRRGSAARVASRLLPWLAASEAVVARAAGEAAAIVLREAPARSLWAVDRELRARSPWSLQGIPPQRVTALAAGAGGLGALALLSMQRNGYTRETAVAWLSPLEDPLALRLLLLRLNDPVPTVAEAALAAVPAWLDLRRADALAAALPLLEAMEHTVRAAKSGIAARAEAVLGSGSPLVRRALWAAARTAKDDDVRKAAVLRLLRGPDEDAIAAVTLGLRDTSPRVRLATARWVAGSGRSPAVRAAVLPQLESNSSPTLRLLSLRLRRGDGSASAHQAVLARCFDANAVVRYHARCQLRERGDAVDFRALALARLADGSDRDALVGALAVLSDLGRREDIPCVQPHAEHPLARVAAEARRTLEVLARG